MPFRLCVVLLACAAVLAACGGGVYIRFGDDDWDGCDDEPPSVGLSSSTSSAAPGDTVELRATASDDVGIDLVTFFRDDDNDSVRLGADDSSPFRWSAVIPDNARGTVEFSARARDLAGNDSDSDSVLITVGR